MTLLQLAEPVFQYVCRLNRIARRATGSSRGSDTATFVKLSREAAVSATPAVSASSGNLDFSVVRAEIKALFDDLMLAAAKDVRLSQEARKIELPLMFFVDSMISESCLPFAAEWNENRLAYDRQELAGDEKFFDLLEDSLKDQSEEAAERLAVFYVCLGLGFSGIYFKQPEFLKRTLMKIAPRVRTLVENDQNAKICPEAYAAVDTRDLVEPPSSRMLIVGLVFGAFLLAVLVTYLIIYQQASTNLNSSFEKVLQQELATERSK